jgi:DNA repair protein RecN (Recombination protein N)
MLLSLRIENYALISSLRLEPSSGLTTITGETGAGKSIMLGAMQLLMGQRAEARVLLDNQKKCVVEALFRIQKKELLDLLEDAGLDAEVETIVRREIAPGGKSRAFVNDTPVTLEILKSIMLQLVDVHSQHETLSLGQEEEQIDLLDALSDQPGILQDYRSCFAEFKALEKELESLQQQKNQESKEADYNAFLLDELKEISLDQMDQSAMEDELRVQENAGMIRMKMEEAIQALCEGESNAQNSLATALQNLQHIRKVSHDLDELYDRLQASVTEVRDIQRELDRKAAGIEPDPERMLFLQQELSRLYRLQKKHQVDGIAALLQIRQSLEQSLYEREHLDELLEKGFQKLQSLEVALKAKGEALSLERKKNAELFTSRLIPILQRVGIPFGQMSINFSSKDPSAKGIDQVSFLFSANKGHRPGPLRQVASGGEFSRLMLGVKLILAEKTSLPTLIFDEIDAGISGEVALQVANLIRTMSQKHQVICITHLPQMAAAGEQHYFVYKDHGADQSVSAIRLLNQQERLQEIAVMIGGARPSTAAIQSAEELLANGKGAPTNKAD